MWLFTYITNKLLWTPLLTIFLESYSYCFTFVIISKQTIRKAFPTERLFYVSFIIYEVFDYRCRHISACMSTRMNFPSCNKHQVNSYFCTITSIMQLFTSESLNMLCYSQTKWYETMKCTICKAFMNNIIHALRCLNVCLVCKNIIHMPLIRCNELFPLRLLQLYDK
jgi:hypothetical protein